MTKRRRKKIMEREKAETKMIEDEERIQTTRRKRKRKLGSRSAGI